MNTFQHAEEAFTYFHDAILMGVCEEEAKETYLEELYRIIKQENITGAEASQVIYEYACKHPKVVTSEGFSLYRIWGYQNGSKKGNLIDPEKFYYHNALRILPNASVKKVIDGKLVTVQSSDFSLRIKPYFSVDDALHYFYKKIGLTQYEAFIKADRSRMESMLQKYDIDLLLFAIDVYHTHFLGKLVMSYNIFAIQEHIEAASRALSEKRALHKANHMNSEVVE